MEDDLRNIFYLIKFEEDKQEYEFLEKEIGIRKKIKPKIAEKLLLRLARQNVHSMMNDNYFLHSLSCDQYPSYYYKLIKEFYKISGDTFQKWIGPTWRTFHNMADDKLVSVKFSEKLVFYTKVAAKGKELFGNLNDFNSWLRQYCKPLNAKPIDLLTTVSGAEIISEEIDRLEEGNVA